MIANGKQVRGIDVPIVKLIPRRERKVGKKYYKRIEASLRAVGLIDPLIVFPQGDSGDPNLYAYGQALAGDDDVCLCWDLEVV